MIKQFFCLFLCCIALSVPTQAVSTDRLNDMESIISETLETAHIPGAVVGVVVDGEVVFLEGFGVRDQEKQLPVTEETIFPIASCTKAFTAFVLGQLVEEGVVSWDDPVIKYLPSFRVSDSFATGHITIRDLLSHRTGLARHDLVWYNSELSCKELLPRLQHLESFCEFRETFHYNNLMYSVAGLLIEEVTGKNWETNVQERIFTPLGMDHSNFSTLDSQNSANFSLPHIEKHDQALQVPFYHFNNIGPAGSINSTANDLLKWIQLQISDDQELISKPTLDEMHHPHITLPFNSQGSAYNFGYGLGWFTGIYKGRYCVGHSGYIDGFVSHTAFLPNEKIGVVVLLNSTSRYLLPNGISNMVFDRLLGENSEDWITIMHDAEQQGRLKEENTPLGDTLPSHPLEEYTGTFEHPGYGTLKTYLDEDSLILEYHTIKWTLKHKGDDVFVGFIDFNPDHPFEFSFHKDASGKTSEVHASYDPSSRPIVFISNL